LLLITQKTISYARYTIYYSFFMFVEGFKRYLKFNRGIREVLEDLMDSVTLKHQELILYCFLSLSITFLINVHCKTI